MQNSLSIDQVYQIYKNNNDAKFIFLIKPSPDIRRYEYFGNLIINQVKGFISPKIFVSSVKAFFYVEKILRKNSRPRPQNQLILEDREFYRPDNAGDTEIAFFPTFLVNRDIEIIGLQCYSFLFDVYGIFINNQFEFNYLKKDQFLNNISVRMSDYDKYLLSSFSTINPDDWYILKYDENDPFKKKKFSFENFSRYALDQGLNGDVLSVIGSFLGPTESELGKQVNKDPNGVFQSRQPLLIEDLKDENDGTNAKKKPKLEG